MSNIGTKIEKLIADGFSYNTLRGLSEAQVNLLYSRLINEEVKQQVTNVTFDPKNTADQQKMASLGIHYDQKTGKITTTTTSSGAIAEESEEDSMDFEKGGRTQQPKQVGPSSNDGFDNYDDGMPTEGEMTEKFESKSQQRLFWAKCNNTKSEKAKKKWCKWAKEYSDDTNFKKLPEKKKDNKLEESLTKLIEKYIPESISKKELMSLIESSTRTKEAPTKTPTKTPTKKPGNPFRIKPHQKPSPKAELDEDKKKVEDIEVFYNKPMKNTNLPFKVKSEVKEAGSGAPAKAPVKTPTKTPSKAPGKKNPFKIEPAQKPGPKAKGPKWLSYNSFINAGFNLK